MGQPSDKSQQKSGASWREKQAENLRENLKKRKLMMKARAQDAAGNAPETSPSDQNTHEG